MDSGIDAATDAATDAADAADAFEGDAGPAFFTTLDSLAASEMLTGECGSVKSLGGVEGLPPRAPVGAGCMFQNTRRFEFHIFFLHEFEETRMMTFMEYVDAVLRRASRTWWGGDVLYQGIAARTFERSFELADYVKVKGASLENGLLHVDLVREIPEAMKPRAIPLTSTSKLLEVKPTKVAA